MDAVMKKLAPVISLVAGLLLAAVLMVLNVNATDKRDRANNVDAALTAPATTAPPKATTTPPPPPATRPPGVVTYAGSVDGGQASVAIVVRNGVAVAYLCDGSRTEAWLQGPASDGALSLTGAHEASLRGTFGNGVAKGTVIAAGRKWTFTIRVVKPPSGLYRAAATVRNAQVVGNWIVVNGKQVGLLEVGDETEPAPLVDTATGTTTIDDTLVPVSPVVEPVN
jgi:hypothetical protein